MPIATCLSLVVAISFLVTGRESDRYRFRIPPLRNIALTSPYFHSGAYGTLEEVVEHYRGSISSIDKYDSSWVTKTFKKNFSEKIFVETNPYMLFKKKNAAHPIFKNREIQMSNSDKSDLVYFLKHALTDGKELN